MKQVRLGSYSMAVTVAGMPSLVAAEIDDAVLAAGAAALMTDGDLALVVTAGADGAGRWSALFSGALLGQLLEGEHRHETPGGRSRLINSDTHFVFPLSEVAPYRRACLNCLFSLGLFGHALEELDSLGIGLQGNDGLFPLGAACPWCGPGALACPGRAWC